MCKEGYNIVMKMQGEIIVQLMQENNRLKKLLAKQKERSKKVIDL